MIIELVDDTDSRAASLLTDMERAVITTALRCRDAERALRIESEAGSDSTRADHEREMAYTKFVDACDALIAKRATQPRSN